MTVAIAVRYVIFRLVTFCCKAEHSGKRLPVQKLLSIQSAQTWCNSYLQPLQLKTSSMKGRGCMGRMEEERMIRFVTFLKPLTAGAGTTSTRPTQSGNERLLFPIPNQQLAVNPNLEQNPGY
jgi:hypothetical protein